MLSLVVSLFIGLFSGLLTVALGVTPFSAIWFAICVPFWIIAGLVAAYIERKIHVSF
jgi:hypothetical protein